MYNGRLYADLMWALGEGFEVSRQCAISAIFGAFDQREMNEFFRTGIFLEI